MAIGDEKAAEILSKCARHCCICRKFRPMHLQIHHLIEKSEGGDNSFDNLIPICTYCHSNVHTITKLTRRFTIEELKKHRNSVYSLVNKGKLPSSESIISEQDIDYIIDKVADKINKKFEKKYSKRSLKILSAAALEVENIISVNKIVSDTNDGNNLRSYSIGIGNYLFISESDENGSPEILSEIIENKLIKEVDGNNYRITSKGVALVEEVFVTDDKYTAKKVKCINCSLHFEIYTWYPERHNKDNISCPECGKKHGNFVIWRQQKFGFIFQEVPGNANFDTD